MNVTKRFFMLGMMVLLAFTLAACMDTSSDGDKDDGADETDTEKVEADEGEEVVKIGYSGPLSGPAAQYGKYVLDGAKMASDEINEEGFEVDGTTYKIELVALDDQYSPNEAGVNAKRMVSEDDPVAILIPHSGGIFAAMEFNEEDEFIIMAYSSEPRMYDQGNDLLMGISPQYDIWAEPFSDYSMDRFGSKLALLPTNSQYGKDWAETITPVWEEKGGEIVFDGDIDFAKETDYFTVISNALEEDPDVLFIGGPSEPTSLVVQQARELGFEGGFMIMDQAKMEEMAGLLDGNELLEGVIGALPIEEMDGEETQMYVEEYKDLYDEPYTTAETTLTYLSVYSLVEGMKEAGTVDDREAIMENLDEGIQNLPEGDLFEFLNGITDEGSMQWSFDGGVVEDGEIITVPMD